MYCPLRFACPGDKQNFDKLDCLKQDCAWWNEMYGKCGVVVDAWLKGRQELVAEAKAEREFRDKRGY